MKRPAFQFYPADWRKDAALQSCSISAQGLWINLMCIAHECEPYGHLTVNENPMSPSQIARLVGISAKECTKLIQELEQAGVISKTEEGAIYSRRMVSDESLRNKRAAGGEGGKDFGVLGAEHGVKGGRPAKSRGVINPPLEPPPSSSSSSSSSTSVININNNPHFISTPQGSGAVDAEIPKTTPAGEICKALKAAGLQSVSPNHPELLALIAKGVTREQFIEAAEAANGKRSPFAYMLSVVKGQLAAANDIGKAPGMPDAAWDLHGGTIRAKAAQVGFEPWTGDGPSTTKQPEPFSTYTERLRAFIEAKKGQS